jgi:A/G-specific adenine glycosylase
MPTRARSSSEAVVAALKETFAARVIAWQRHAGRHDLPWQKTRDAYRIWLSEVMLQQTQVATVLPYYERFLKAFPDVATLARAAPDEVMAHWSGLGYYSRARNLHRAARDVIEHHGGRVPQSAALLETLPGIGRSSAAAIAAFAFGERAAILDGNVKRVLCRVFGIERPMQKQSTERELVGFALGLLPEHGIERYTQGLMDLGATVCTAKAPRCPDCPFANDCIARASGRIATLPAPREKRITPRRKASFVLARHSQSVWLERRPERGIWGGLWCLPASALDARSGASEAQLLERFIKAPAQAGVASEFARFEHAFTHFTLLASVFAIDCRREDDFGRDGRWVPWRDCASLGLPAPIKTLLLDVQQGLFR